MTISIENAAKTWDVLADRLETFIASWEAGGGPPLLGDHLPDGSTDLQRLTLIELVKIDLEYRRQTGAPIKRVEEYLAEFPVLGVDGFLPSDLIYEEYHVRRSAGEAVEPQEYFDRFPQQAEELQRLMGVDKPDVTMSLIQAGARPADLEAGKKIDDFDLLVKLGKGAFASVFLARQCSMQRLVALKVSADKGTEPQTLAQLDHPYIVRVYDQRLLPEQHLRLLYMQYVAGGTLQGVIERARALPMEQRSGRLLLESVDAAVESGGQTPLADSGRRRRVAALSWPEVVCTLGAQLAAALDYAHRKGVLHRDIKPANVLLAADLSPKLADFNISFSSNLEGATPAAFFGGSLAYMSPEQLEACNPTNERQPDELDGRSDLYSLGVMLWELLYASRPFVDEKLAGRWSQTLEEMAKRRRLGPPRIGVENADGDCETQLRLVLTRCLASEPGERHATGEELYRELLLCREPHTRRLMSVPRRGWREAARQFPFVAILLAALVPNIAASLFNLCYNNFVTLDGFQLQPEQWLPFCILVGAVNVVGFSVGAAIGLWLAWPVVRGVAHREPAQQRIAENRPSADNSDADAWIDVRRRALLLGHYVAVVGIVLWSATGLVYPLGMCLIEKNLWWQFPNFVASFVLCGLIAGAYPFFGITYLAVRVFYPALVRRASAGEFDQATFERVTKLTGRYLLVAGGVPLLGIAVFALIIASHATQTNAHEGFLHAIVLAILSVAGGLGFLAAYYVYAALHRDIAALAKAAAPADPFGTATDSVGMF